MAVLLTVASGDIRGYADTQHALTFAGRGYAPMPLRVEGWGQSSQQSLPTIKVTVPNIDGAVGAFLEETSLLGNDVTLQLLHLDLLGTTTDVDSVRLEVMLVEWSWEVATFTLGINLGLQDQLPRHVMSRQEYAGIPDSIRRASIL